MTSFMLKIIAVLCMLSDHCGDAIVGHFSFFNLIGRIAFPIFAFQAVHGYKHTKDLKKHLFRLLVFAIISQGPFALFLSTFTNDFCLNIFFTFLLALIIIFIYSKCKNKYLGFLVVIIGSFIGEFIKVDYGAFGILIIFAFYFFEYDFYNIFEDNTFKIFKFNFSYRKLLMCICVTMLCFAKYVNNIMETPNLLNHYLTCGLFTSLSLIFILFYNKKQGPKAKYFFYAFYPLHLLILYFIHLYMYNVPKL